MTLDRSKRPLEQGKISFSLPEIKKFKISNGLDVYFVEKKNLPIVQFNLLVQSGSKNDPAEKKGLAYLTAALIDEGAGEYDSLSLDNEIEKLGSVLGITADHDNIILSMLMLKENIERSVELFSKIVLEPNFDEKEFEREKLKVRTKIQQMKDNPGYIAKSVFEKVVNQDTAYSFPIFGNEESINKIINEDVKEFYSSNFSIPNSTLIVVGDIDKQELKDLLEKHFRTWENHIMNMDKIETPFQKPTQFYLVHKEDAPQSEIRIGHLSSGRNNPDYYAKNLLNTILGGQFTSRINLNLREDKGFTYGASSRFNYYKNTGYFVVGTSVESKYTGASVSEIIKELKMVRKNISEEELNFVKSYLVKRYPSLFETNSQIAGSIANIITYNLAQDYLDTFIDKTFTTTLDQVNAAAENHILPDKLVVLVVGNRNEVLTQLEEISEKDIIELDVEGNNKD